MKTWIDAFLPNITNIRVYPFPNQMDEHLFGHLDSSNFSLSDPTAFHFTYGSFPTEEFTLLGIIIDWAYFELTWDTHFGRSAVWIPAMSQAFQFAWLLLPMVMIWLVNAVLSYSYLKLERRQAIIFGAIMGFFTAPWLLPTIPYAFGWVV